MADAAVPVVIVGGGPVGLLLAVLLAQGGENPVVVEQRSEISPRPRAIGIHPPGVAALAAAGIDVTGEGLRIVGGIARADGRTLGGMAFADPGVWALPQQRIERMLRQRFEALRPGGLRLGVQVSALRRTAAGVEVVGPGGAVLAVAGLVVGADGVASTVRAAAGIRVRRVPGRARYLMADVPGPAVGENGEAVLSFERAGVIESFPLPGGRRWVALLTAATGAPEPTAAALTAMVAERTGQAVAAAGEASRFTARQRLAATMVADRVVLIGDAAHEISPIGGQGLSLGWLDARALAELVLRSPHPSPREWARFDRTRRRSARRAAGYAAFNMVMGRALPAPLHWCRSQMIRMLATLPTRRLLAEAFTMRRR